MSDDTPHRPAGLGDEPEFGVDASGDSHTSSVNIPNEWLREAKVAQPVPQRALRSREEWADVPWGQKPKRLAPEDASTFERVSTDAANHRRRKLRISLLLTVASAVLPGSGLLGAPSRGLKVVGAVTSLLAIGAGAYFLTWALVDTAGFAANAVDPRFLARASVSLIIFGLLWVTLIAATHIATRPDGLIQGKRLLGAGVVAALAFAVSTPSALGARYSHDTAMLVETVFGSGELGSEDEVLSSTRPTLGTDPAEDPWKDIPRVNLLLLGADGSEARADAVEQFGIRTDTIILASIDTVTGDTLLVQIPRNVQYTPFPEGSELEEIWPRGFRGEQEDQGWLTNLWTTVELQYPDLLLGNTYRGAEALKQGVEGITGLEADYFMMLDIDGLQQLINAMGGVRVNINEPLPMGTARNCRDEERCLMPGPNQRLNGYEAMWYARSRVTTSDYSRMARQSCLIDAVIKQANPTTMLTSYEGIAKAASHMVTTDIPPRDLKAFVQLAFKVKDAKVERLLYSNLKNGYNYDNPDFEAMQQAVTDALNPPSPEPVVTPSTTPTATSEEPSPEPTTASPTPTETTLDELAEGAQTVQDVCAWHGDPDEDEGE